MTDPGAFSTLQSEEKNISAILITHEHQDHIDLPALRTVLDRNPHTRILTNRGVGAILTHEGIAHELLEHGQKADIDGVSIEGYGERHAVLYPTIPQVTNTGYSIAGRFFYPGDALFIPEERVEMLALPVGGPWLKLSEAIDYAKAVAPKTSFPVHDGMFKTPGIWHRMPSQLLSTEGIGFTSLDAGGTIEF